MADALRSIDQHLLIMIFCFGLLAISIFLKKIAIYMALAASWCAILFNTGGEWSDYMRAAALLIIVWALLQLRRLQKGESGT